MNRSVCLLLIPFFVLGQCLPHSHAGTGVGQPNGHDLRPHVHLSEHLHDHGHSHQDDGQQPSDHQDESDANGATLDDGGLQPATDHDDDAIYLASSAQATSRLAGPLVIDLHSNAWLSIALPTIVELGSRLRTNGPPDRHTTLPIYLLTASLRL